MADVNAGTAAGYLARSTVLPGRRRPAGRDDDRSARGTRTTHRHAVARRARDHPDGDPADGDVGNGVHYIQPLACQRHCADRSPRSDATRRLRCFSALLSALFFVGLAAGALWLTVDAWNDYEQSELLHIPFRPLRVISFAAAATIAMLFVRDAVRPAGDRDERYDRRHCTADPAHARRADRRVDGHRRNGRPHDPARTGTGNHQVGRRALRNDLPLRTRRAAAVPVHGASVFRRRREPRFLRCGRTNDRSPARRPGAGLDRRLCRLRRRQRLESRDRRDDRTHRAAGDAQAWLLGCVRDWLHRRRRHTRIDHSAVGCAHRVRHSGRTIDRQAVHSGHHSRHHPGAVLHGDDRAAVPLAPFDRAGRRKAPWSERRAALLRMVDLAALILVVLGGIALGWFTPTEAASVGAVGALALCAWRRALSWKTFAMH